MAFASNESLLSTPSQPEPPELGEKTHHSLEFKWKPVKVEEEEDSRCSYRLEIKADTSPVEDFKRAYIGFLTHCELVGLNASQNYEVRLCAVSSSKRTSPWSECTHASTTGLPEAIVNLHMAVRHDNAAKIRSMIENRINPDIPDETGNTPIMNAAKHNSLLVVKELIKQDTLLTTCNSAGKTALMIAAQKGYVQIVKLLVENGVSLWDRDRGGSMPIHYACVSGERAVLRYIVATDPTMLEAVDGNGLTPLMHCASNGGKIAAARALIGLGADVNAQERSTLQTPLMLAIVNQYDDLAELLINSGASVRSCDKHGKSALDCAKMFGGEKVQYILRTHLKSNSAE